MGTKFLTAVGVFPVNQLTKFQRSALQIGQDSALFIYLISIILGSVHDVISYLICIF